MKYAATIFFLSFLSVNIVLTQSTHIHVDQFGYQKNASKYAILVDPQLGFNSSESYNPSSTIEVRMVGTNQVVFTGSPTQWNGGNTDPVSGDKGWWYDFSSVTSNGSYYIHDVANNMSSPAFEIKEEPYREVLRAATKMFYYNRCNFTKATPYAGPNWTDGMNFLNPLQDANCRLISDSTNAALEKDLSGGWFDAGDYNKYVTFAYAPVHNLLTAYHHTPTLFTDNWNLPESGNGVPDILDEVKWELDWLLKMTNNDGSVHIKMGSQNYSDNSSSPPSANTDQRFYGPTCSSASIANASMLAHAAVVFEGIPSMQTYAAQLKTAAESCFAHGVTFFNNNNFEIGCDDNSLVSGNTDWNVTQQMQGLISAAVYLYKATNASSYQTFLINNGYLVSPLQDNYWSGYDLPVCDALIYYTEIIGANTGMQGSIINSASGAVTNNWSGYFGMTNPGLYRDFMPEWSYHWGSNNIKASYGALNMAIGNLGVGDSTSLRQKGESMLHTFHGVNPLGLVYLSNMYSLGAEKSVNEIYHAWFADGTDYDNALTSPKGPPPGYMSGGPNKWYSVATMTPPYGQPDAKSYFDFNDNWPNNSWEVSEPAIYYQAIYVRLLSDIIGSEYATLELETKENVNLQIYPNPSQDKIWISGINGAHLIEIYDLIGNKVLAVDDFHINQSIDVSRLLKGIYIIRICTDEVIFDRMIQKN